MLSVGVLIGVLGRLDVVRGVVVAAGGDFTLVDADGAAVDRLAEVVVVGAVVGTVGGDCAAELLVGDGRTDAAVGSGPDAVGSG